MGNKNTKKSQQATNKADNKQDSQIPSDVLGSYTGVPEDGEEPIQDADDL